MTSVFLCSKNRPMQTHAYIKSLTFYSDFRESDIHVLYACDEGFNYSNLIEAFPGVNWHLEYDFLLQLKKIISMCDDYILMGVEDVFFTDYFNLNSCIEVMKKREDVFGFSLRLGRNIQGTPSLDSIPEFENTYCWDWTLAQNNHWAYPWEISASIYRKSDINEMLENWASDVLKPGLKPNSLEHQPWLKLKKMKENNNVKKKLLACFGTSKSLTLCVNKVSATSQTWVDAVENSDLPSLMDLYQNGVRLDWKSFQCANNERIHVGSSYFRLSGSNKEGLNNGSI